MLDLSNLKVGDEVIVTNRWNDDIIKTIDKITPSGRIKIGSSYFNKDGSERNSDIWNISIIRPCTEDEKIEIKQKNTCKKAIEMMHSTKSISYENALKIISLFRG